MSLDEYEELVLGHHLPMSIGQFKRQAAVLIQSEQDQANPDNGLIEFAANAIRLAREHGSYYHNTLDALARHLERRRQLEQVERNTPPTNPLTKEG
jgi:hypothetical protein